MCDLVELANSLVPYIVPGSEEPLDGMVGEIVGSTCSCFSNLYSAVVVIGPEEAYLQLVYSQNGVVQMFTATYNLEGEVTTSIVPASPSTSITIPAGSRAFTLTPTGGLCSGCNKKKDCCCCEKKRQYRKVYDECGNLVATQACIDCCEDDCNTRSCVIDYAVGCPDLGCVSERACIQPKLDLGRSLFIPKQPSCDDEDNDYPETYNLIKHTSKFLKGISSSFSIKYDPKNRVYNVFIPYTNSKSLKTSLKGQYKKTPGEHQLYFNLNKVPRISLDNSLLKQLRLHNGAMKYSIDPKEDRYEFVLVDKSKTDHRVRDYAETTTAVGDNLKSIGLMTVLEEKVSKHNKKFRW